MKQDELKKEWLSPELTVYGSIEEITQAWKADNGGYDVDWQKEDKWGSASCPCDC